MRREAERRRSEDQADLDGGQELHAGGYAFLSPLHTDKNPTHITQMI